MSTDAVFMTIISGGTVQRVTDVLAVDTARGRVQIVCHPDATPRWVSLTKPRTVPSLGTDTTASHTGTLMSGQVTCTCGWSSSRSAVATDAIAEFDHHLTAVPSLGTDTTTKGSSNA